MDFNDFLSFRQMVSMQIIKIIYILGLAVITIGGIVTLLNNFLTGLIAIIFGNLIWRLICETSILLFSMHEILGSIDNKLKEN